MIEYLLIVLGVLIFGLQHSGISALRVKNRIINRWGKEGYAKLFNATSIVGIIVPFIAMNYWNWFYFVIEPAVIQPLLFVSGVVLVIIGLVVTRMASRVISVSTVADMRTDRKAELVTGGIYSRTRHPLYLATILLLLGLAALYPFDRVIVFSIALSFYVIIGAYLEERKLVIHYGDAYLEYRKQAGFMLPRIRSL
ncbi:MAG: methyltransferase family protein [Candidatus Thorarchaeota archaeon]